MYGVLYAISPEIFPAKDRGTGNALTATATRVFGVLVGALVASRCIFKFKFSYHAIVHSGSDHRPVRGPLHGGACVHLGRTDLPCVRIGAAHPVRAAGESVTVGS
jgi:hypothetical protein